MAENGPRELTRGGRNAGEFLLFFLLSFSSFFLFLFFCASYARVRDAKRLSIVYYVMYDDGSWRREAPPLSVVSSTATGSRSRRIRRFFHRWRPGDLDKAGASSCASSSSSSGRGRVSSRGTRKNAARSVSVRQSGGAPRLVTTAGCGRRLIGGRRKNLFREKLTCSGRSTCSRDLPLLSHFSQTARGSVRRSCITSAGVMIKVAVAPRRSALRQSSVNALLRFLARLPVL